ncbi:protein Atg16l2 [Silurus meridionalis]|uniref:Autophagy-related protein 16 domain-containing protein n=1 Tax=Silurus meridionalis TaxID=175797 RepID=A0A8T0B3L6_SILME|nr:protein Atg16l2 [Silurus meridionalis]KAF7700105.1 hypothetical protein HF521_003063 [Silurus meridionalis]KAI5098989.1 autophagy-related protein 16-2-like [Silurus meridionalis]
MATTEHTKPGRQFRKTSPDSEHSEPWKRHIILQLKHRDKAQKIAFQDVIRSYVNLLERCAQSAVITQGLLSSPRSFSSSEDLSSLKTATGELAYKVVELQQQIKNKDTFLERQHARLNETQVKLKAVEVEKDRLKSDVKVMTDSNLLLKNEYDTLRERCQHLDEDYRKENLHGSVLVEKMVHMKEQAAARMNHLNERRLRARQAGLHKELEMAANKTLNIDKAPHSVSLPSSPLLRRKEGGENLPSSQTRVFRSASVTSPRLLGSIRGLFEKKRRGNSVSSLEEDVFTPIGVCLVARVPNRVIFAVDAHELGINAVRFGPSSNLLATGGTDRVIKLWEVISGMLHHRGTLDGSNAGITSIEFDSTGSRILAGSNDNSALIWRLDDSVPKFTLTGHSRKVTAAKFKCNLRQVVTGSGDRTVKIWDLGRAACIQTIEVFSYCSDLVCSEYYIISGHFDRKIRFWDSRAASCTQEVPLQGRVTSLDISPNHREVLSCSRDESLQLVDLRMSNTRMTFRADGFKCGSDSTKAIFSPDGSYLAAGSADGTVYIWNINTGNLETRLPVMHRTSVNAVAWSMSGEYMVSVDKSRCAMLWSDI